MGEQDNLEVDLDALAAALDIGALIVDVRRRDEFVQAHVPGATLIPLDELGSRLHEIPKGERIFLICAVGGRSRQAATALQSAGWDAVSVAGGIEQWVGEGRPFDTGWV